MPKKGNEVSIFVVSKGRYLELSRLLDSLNKSAKNNRIKPNLTLGIEENSYKNLKKYSHLFINKIFFKKNTSPIIIKNHLYNLNLPRIKIFLDDDVEVQKNFFKYVLYNYKINDDCFLRLTPVNFFTKKIKNISNVNSIEFVGFVELGKKKFNQLIKLNFVAEDTELSNRINSQNYPIFEDNRLQIIHHISKKNRNLENININGTKNSIEIFRAYGAIKNFKNIIDLLYRTLISIFIYKKFSYLKIIFEKMLFTNLGINFTYCKNCVLPPYKNYSLNYDKKIKNKKLKLLKNIKKIEYPVLARIGTFEKYQKIEKKLKAAIYIGPKHDKFKITKNFFFSKSNFSDSTFLNLYNFLKKKKKINDLIIVMDNHYLNYNQIFLQLNNIYFRKSIKKISNCLLFIDGNWYNFDKIKYLNYIYFFNFFTFPFKIASFLLTLIIIMPVKFKITPKYNKNYNFIVNSQ